jgi:hypothetical protein
MPFGKRQHFLQLIGRGFFGFLSMSSFYYGLTHVPLGEAVVLTFTSPIFTAILARLILKYETKQLFFTDFFYSKRTMGEVRCSLNNIQSGWSYFHCATSIHLWWSRCGLCHSCTWCPSICSMRVAFRDCMWCNCRGFNSV